ncbi:hypothetical protein D3C87_1088130 [compost metagenome]
MLEQVAGLEFGVIGIAVNTHAHIGRDLHTRRKSRHLAAPTGNGDVRTHDIHPRPQHAVFVDRITQRDIGERAIGAQVVHRRETRAQGLIGMFGPHQRDVLRRMQERFRHVVGHVPIGDMRVHVDQPRQHGPG